MFWRNVLCLKPLRNLLSGKQSYHKEILIIKVCINEMKKTFELCKGMGKEYIYISWIYYIVPKTHDK